MNSNLVLPFDARPEGHASKGGNGACWGRRFAPPPPPCIRTPHVVRWTRHPRACGGASRHPKPIELRASTEASQHRLQQSTAGPARYTGISFARSGRRAVPTAVAAEPVVVWPTTVPCGRTRSAFGSWRRVAFGLPRARSAVTSKDKTACTRWRWARLFLLPRLPRALPCGAGAFVQAPNDAFGDYCIRLVTSSDLDGSRGLPCFVVASHCTWSRTWLCLPCAPSGRSERRNVAHRPYAPPSPVQSAPPMPNQLRSPRSSSRR